jgi:GNAT superfamily N-acetyltransferase
LSVIFRKALAADVATIHALLCENAENDGGSIAGTEESLLQYGFRDDPRFRVVLAERDDTALGLALFFPEYSSWRGTMGVFVQDLYLKPAARGLGLGRGLLAASVNAAADWEPTFVTLMVQHNNADARSFYTAQGFTLREKADVLICEGEALTRLIAR